MQLAGKDVVWSTGVSTPGITSFSEHGALTEHWETVSKSSYQSMVNQSVTLSGGLVYRGLDTYTPFGHSRWLYTTSNYNGDKINESLQSLK